MFVGNEKTDTLIDFCFLRRVRVYTKKLVKAATFLKGIVKRNFFFHKKLGHCT